MTTFENARVVFVPEPTAMVLLVGLSLGLLTARHQRDRPHQAVTLTGISPDTKPRPT